VGPLLRSGLGSGVIRAGRLSIVLETQAGSESQPHLFRRFAVCHGCTIRDFVVSTSYYRCLTLRTQTNLFALTEGRRESRGLGRATHNVESNCAFLEGPPPRGPRTTRRSSLHRHSRDPVTAWLVSGFVLEPNPNPCRGLYRCSLFRRPMRDASPLCSALLRRDPAAVSLQRDSAVKGIVSFRAFMPGRPPQTSCSRLLVALRVVAGVFTVVSVLAMEAGLRAQITQDPTTGRVTLPTLDVLPRPPARVPIFLSAGAAAARG
jgi:hypothetical protein